MSWYPFKRWFPGGAWSRHTDLPAYTPLLLTSPVPAYSKYCVLRLSFSAIFSIMSNCALPEGAAQKRIFCGCGGNMV